MTIDKIREIVNLKVPGVGRGIVDYTLKNISINTETPSSEEIKRFIDEIVKHIQTLYGTEKAEGLKKELDNF